MDGQRLSSTSNEAGARTLSRSSGTVLAALGLVCGFSLTLLQCAKPYPKGSIPVELVQNKAVKAEAVYQYETDGTAGADPVVYALRLEGKAAGLLHVRVTSQSGDVMVREGYVSESGGRGCATVTDLGVKACALEIMAPRAGMHLFSVTGPPGAKYAVFFGLRARTPVPM